MGWTEVRKTCGIVAGPIQTIPAITAVEIHPTARDFAKATSKAIANMAVAGGNRSTIKQNAEKPLAKMSAAFLRLETELIV